MSSQVVWAQVSGSLGALLVSPFNVKWRFSALAGGVEGSKFCLFSVVLPARFVSVSPRFHYRRHAFCFLPLAAILEFLEIFLTISEQILPLPPDHLKQQFLANDKFTIFKFTSLSARYNSFLA
jgi:hypothetical protein